MLKILINIFHKGIERISNNNVSIEMPSPTNHIINVPARFGIVRTLAFAFLLYEVRRYCWIKLSFP